VRALPLCPASWSLTRAHAATIVQLFEWNWASVQAECATLGQLGYKYVQVSPAAEHIAGGQWWTSYQRVSGQLTSKRGNRDQFGAMVAACQAAGVGVLVDVILNHMTAGSGTGVGGSGPLYSCLPVAGILIHDQATASTRITASTLASTSTTATRRTAASVRRPIHLLITASSLTFDRQLG
jgi:hypothetical protein